ncbi:hypothetical protein [Halovenus salina]|uniref:Uncharacterized protein n=1 Tax=Halovenus salina TaxID=1510225 RepID=A0ABD5W4E7_9EURY
MDRLEHPSIRWGIAFVFLGVELLSFLAADLPLVDQIVAVGISVILFILLPSILKDVSEKGRHQSNLHSNGGPRGLQVLSTGLLSHCGLRRLRRWSRG